MSGLRFQNGAETASPGTVFSPGFFSSPEWKSVERTLREISTVTNASELWACLIRSNVSADPRFAESETDYEPVLDKIQTGSTGDDFSLPCSSMPNLFTGIIPKIAELILQAPTLFESEGVHLRLLSAKEDGVVVISHRQVASLLAMAFLGIGLPAASYARGIHPIPGEIGNFPFPSMTGLIWPKRGCDFPPNVHKVRCFLCFFEQFCVVDRTTARDDGAITIRRVVANESIHTQVASLAQSQTPLCTIHVQPLKSSIEEQSGVCRVDFANNQIGGGVFLNTPGSTAQEEITFVTHPELCVAKLICEQMQPDEALIISGARHVARHSGYSASFCFEGASDGAVADCVWLAIDALRFPDENAESQFLGSGTSREVLKALTGFYGVINHTNMKVVATGAWGCGAFNGDPEVKLLVQWAAASEAGVSALMYHTWDDSATAEVLARLAAIGNSCNVGQLWKSADIVAKRLAAEADVTHPLVSRGRFLDAIFVELRQSLELEVLSGNTPQTI